MTRTSHPWLLSAPTPHRIPSASAFTSSDPLTRRLAELHHFAQELERASCPEIRATVDRLERDVAALAQGLTPPERRLDVEMKICDLVEAGTLHPRVLIPLGLELAEEPDEAPALAPQPQALQPSIPPATRPGMTRTSAPCYDDGDTCTA